MLIGANRGAKCSCKVILIHPPNTFAGKNSLFLASIGGYKFNSDAQPDKTNR